ncbi:hypothetical protein [Rhizobacter sp. P5_C2]
MSSYSCVVPLDWQALWERVLPAWLAVRAGAMPAGEFYAKYVPAGDAYGDLLTDDFSAPADHLALFNSPLQPPYLRIDLRDSSQRTGFLKVADSGVYLLAAAITQTAVVNLPGNDPFADDVFGGLRDPSGLKQVAGTKNRYAFLEAAFDVRWEPQRLSYYAYSRREEAPPRLQELLESLFLYERVLPGCWFAPQSPAWPGFDDLSFAGYLSPVEVIALRDQLTSWEGASVVEDPLFPIFADRVNRAAMHELGLLTVHDGL